MDVARVNFSHGTREERGALISAARAAASAAGERLPVMQDLCGPKFRIGKFAAGQADIRAGARFTLSTKDIPGDANGVSINCPELMDGVHRGDRLLLGDGEFELRVRSKDGTGIDCEVVAGGLLRSGKGIHAPGVKLDIAVPTARDLEDLDFGLKAGVDLVAMSFVREAGDIRALKEAIRKRGGQQSVIAKIEKAGALESLDEILREADGVMVARGDLGLDIPLEKVPLAQKEIIRKANAAGVPVITATQMLESMMENPRPTRAEMADIANAILDGTDAVMLSGETAVGKYPVEAVAAMDAVAGATEASIDYVEMSRRLPIGTGMRPDEAAAHAACRMALETGAGVIVCCTRSGRTARLVARCRPRAAIAVASSDEGVLMRSMILWGAVPVKVSLAQNTDDLVTMAKGAVVRDGIAKKGDLVVLVAGVPPSVSGTTNMVRVEVL
jgi:pyruvate kinase